MNLPIVDPPDAPAGDGVIIGILLAAGTSSRFGEANKLLVEIDGEPIVRAAAQSLVSSRVDDVIVVVGYEADRIREVLADLPVSIVDNPAYADGQATSVRIGAESARGRADAVVFALGDMPRVAPASVDALIAAYLDGAGDALAAACDGQRGNPVLFDARFFDRLAAVTGDSGARDLLLDSDAAALVETGDQGVLADVDTDRDLERLRTKD